MREIIYIWVAYLLTLYLTPIFILNFLSANYLISDIEHLIKFFVDDSALHNIDFE